MPLSEIKPDDAKVIFGKWQDEDSTILCSGAFFGCAFNLIGKVFSVSEKQVEFRGLDPRCNLIMRFDADDCLFWYVEPKDLPIVVPEYAKELGGVGVGLPLRFSSDEFNAGVTPAREKLLFFELRVP